MKMEKIRFIDLSTHDAYTNMAIDEAIMLALQDTRVPPTMRLYRWQPSAVSIGTFQGMTAEVNVEACKREGIDIVRRITGGGAVYHDYDGEITYSIILPRGHRLAPADIQKSYETICNGIIWGLHRLGIKAHFAPINDVVVANRKISGNAQTRRHSCLLQHGTVLVSLDVEKMFSVLRVSAEKVSDKAISDVKQRVTSIKDVLGRSVSFSEVRNALKAGFEEALEIELVPGSLTPAEMANVERLVREKYKTDEWNFLR